MYTACVPSEKDTETEPAETLIREETEPVTSAFDVRKSLRKTERERGIASSMITIREAMPLFLYHLQ